MAKKKSYKGKKQYGLYQTGSRYSKNKKAKLLRHLKAHPEDAKAKSALESIPAYSRKKPHSRKWRSVVKLITVGEGKGQKQIKLHLGSREAIEHVQLKRKIEKAYKVMMQRGGFEKWVERNFPRADNN